MKPWGWIFIPLILLFLALGFRLIDPPFLEEIQLKVFDVYQRLKPRVYQEAPVRIIDIDEESLKRLGQWPWPRTRIAQLIDRLNELGASAIVFDMIFPEPDRTSPANILPLWSRTPAVQSLRSQLDQLPDHDRILGESIRKAKVVLGFALTQEANANQPSVKNEFSFVGKSPAEFLPAFHGAIMDLPNLETASVENGGINIIQERDGMVRRVPLFFRLNETFYPSLVTGAVSVYQGEPGFLIRYAGDSGKRRFGEQPGIVSVHNGNDYAPTDERGRMWLYDTGFISNRFLPVWKILSDDYKSLDLKGKI